MVSTSPWLATSLQHGAVFLIVTTITIITIITP
jgi:hypothetical protein